MKHPNSNSHRVSRAVAWTVFAALAVVVLGAVLWRAGMTRSWVQALSTIGGGQVPRPITLRVWDWWSPSGNEEYGYYFEDLERAFEAQNADIDVVYQIVPFGNYVQKLSTAMVGRTPPDVFQSSVYWAEGFFHRGMLRSLNGLIDIDGGTGPTRVAKDAFLPSAWRHNHAPNGDVFGIPQIIDAQCLVWNLDILEKAAESDGQIRAMFMRRADGSLDTNRIRYDAVRDWEHFRAICRKLTKRGPDGEFLQSGFVIHAYGGGAGMFSPWLAANGGRYQDEAGRTAHFNSPRGAQAMSFLAGLYWQDRVCPPFVRQLSEVGLFEEGKVAAVVAGTWSGKDIMRDTLGWSHFGKTAFPPGPSGEGHKTVTWGNMLVITRRCEQVAAAWRYVKFVCSLEGNLLRLKHLGYNGPRLDFYNTPQWAAKVQTRPYLSNVKQICLVGDKLRHTEIIAVNHQANPIIETILLRYPSLVAGEGPYKSVQAALDVAADHVNNVYDRYNRQVRAWSTRKASVRHASER